MDFKYWLERIHQGILNHLFQTSILFVIVFLTLFIFRYKIFYSQYQYKSYSDQNWSKVLSFGDYIDSLLTHPEARKQKISYDLVNDIYLTNIDDNEKISIKKMKSSTFFFRIFLQIISRGPIWFLRHSLSERNKLTASPTPVLKEASDKDAILFDQNHVQILLYKKNDELDINEKLLEAIIENIPDCQKISTFLSNNERGSVFKNILKPMIHFVRGAGYLHHRKLTPKETEWKNKDFFKTVVEIGASLDPIVFRVRIRLAHTLPNITIPVPKPDFIIFEYRSNAFLSVEETAKNQINTARQKLKDAQKLVKEHMQDMSLVDEDFFPRPETIVDNLMEPERFEVQSPELLANDNKVSQIFLKNLRLLGVLPIKKALINPLVEISNRFVKAYGRKSKNESHKPLLNQVTAFKLGLDPKWFDFNSGFENFALKTHLHRYLFTYGHEILVDAESGDISLLFDGKLSTWKDIFPKLKFDATGEFSGHYSIKGLVNYDLYEWEELLPFYIENSLPPPWGERYLCEICSWIIDKPRVRGDHTFVRLKTPTGEWYSVGQYVPSKLGYDSFMFPMSLKPSRFMSPDVSEFYKGHFTTLSFEITPEQFNLMKTKIEHDKKQGVHLYQVYKNNCTIWAKSIAELADLDLPSSLSAADLIAPDLTAFGRKVHKMRYTPKWLKPIVKLIWAIFLNSFGLILGSGMVHKRVKNDPNFKTAEPYIRSWRDIMDLDKVVSQHPFVIGTFVRQQVEKWRDARIGILTNKLTLLLEKLPNEASPIASSTTKEDESLISPDINQGESQVSDNVENEEVIKLKESIRRLQQEIDHVRYDIPDRFKKQKKAY